jgi:4-amino-4-deoxy-L-arabinose transferase-like glycosyltransferase
MAGSRTSRRAHLADCGWFWAWALVGAAVALGAMSLGPILAAPVFVIAALMWSRPGIRRSAFGLLSGAGALLLYVAWVQRAGPGTTCWETPTASGCDQHLNPLPWLLAGIGLFVGGIVAHARRA